MAHKLKAHELREKSPEDLRNMLDAAKAELADARIAKVTQGGQTKIAKIKGIRKNIARLMTVYNHGLRTKLRAETASSKHLNKDLRVKKTRAIRRRLTKDQLFVKATSQPKTEKSGGPVKKLVRRTSLRVAKRQAYFPQRVYAVKA